MRQVSLGIEEAYEELTQKIDEALKCQSRPFILAIDGKSGSGKSTLGERLAAQYGANLYHMDDFFLQPYQRTPERLSETGGNVDYERFKEEVLKPLLQNQEFSYGIFSCRQQSITEYRQAGHALLHIVEGSYSEHPYFDAPYDMTVCLDIGEEEQKERIRLRNGEDMLKRFVSEWIPKENAYLEKYQIIEQCDFYVRV